MDLEPENNMNAAPDKKSWHLRKYSTKSSKTQLVILPRGIKKTGSNHTGTKHGQIITVRAEHFGLGDPSL